MSIRTFDEAVQTLRLVYTGRCNYLWSYLSWWQEEFGPTKVLAEITADDVDRGVTRLLREPAMQFKRGQGTVVSKKQRSAGTVNKYIGVLCTLFKLLRQSRYLPRSFVSPVVRGLKLQEPEGKTLQVCLDDVHRLIAGARLTRNAWLPALVAVGCVTGLRKGNLQALRWGDIDLEQGTIDVARTKNGTATRSVLPTWALDELKKLDGDRGHFDYVFGQSDFKKAFASALKHAGLPETWTIHSMRHIAASILAQSGASVVTIMGVLNHKSPSMSMRYSHLNTTVIKEAVNKAWN